MKTTFLTFCLMLSAWLAANAFATTTDHMVFTLDDPHTGSVLARGEETTSHFNDNIEITSRYSSLDGQPLMIESYRFSPGDDRLIRLWQETMGTGEHSEVLVQGDAAEVRIRTARGELDTTKVTWGRAHTVGPLLARLVVRDFEQLKRGETLRVELFVPQMARAFSYCGDLESSSVVMQPCNLLLRPFAPSLSFGVSTEGDQVRIQSYEGPGPVVLNGKPNHPVRIRFDQKGAQNPPSSSAEPKPSVTKIGL